MKNKMRVLLEAPRIADLLHLHLRLDVIGKSPKCAGGIIEAGRFDLHFAAIAVVGGGFQISETIFFQDRGVGGIGRGWIFGGLYALRLSIRQPLKVCGKGPAGAFDWPDTDRRQQKDNREKTQRTST